MLRKEVGALRQEAQDAKEQARPQQQHQEEMAEAAEGMHAQAVEASPPPQEDVIAIAASPSPPASAEEEPPSPAPIVVADDTGTWRRRYEHLAGLLAEQTKQNSAMVRGSTWVVRLMHHQQ